MRRRLDLAASLIATPPVLFLDEPTTGLDPSGRLAMWERIRDLRAGGVTLLLTTQYLEEADYLADLIAVIEHGRTIALGTADELKRQIGGERIDKISPEMRQRYLQASPYNLVRIILGERRESDSDSDNVYTRAARHLADWTAQGILARDPEPALFAYFQEFSMPDSGERLVRKGFIGLGAVEEYSAGVVHRHEQTLSGPKKDRLELLRHTHAHFGQLFILNS